MISQAIEEVQCSLCGKSEVSIVYKSDFLDLSEAADIKYNYSAEESQYKTGRIVRCLTCGLIYVSPRIRGVEKKYETETVDERYLRSMPQRNLTFERDIKRINKIISPGSILDIGCSCGAFLEIARRYGWETCGIELNRQALDISHSKGLCVHGKTLKEISFEGSVFDVIIMWGVVEHFSDPLSELREMARILRNGGYLFITTADVSTLIANILGKKSPCYLGQHLYYFSKKTLAQMLRKSGFSVLEINSHSQFLQTSYFLEEVTNRYSTIGKILNMFASLSKLDKSFLKSSLFGLEIMAVAKKV